MRRNETIDAAKELINGDRAKDYGDAYNNHARIAEGWNVIMREALKTHGYLTPAHVALMMDWLKTSRLLTNMDKFDSWVDKIGYSALGAECVVLHARSLEQLIEDTRSGRFTNGDVRTQK
jgi:hypothetical protein